MIFAFFSDIHGNLPALEIAIKESGKVDGYVILGDVVNYGPWSNECVKLIETLPNCIKIRGNHEEYFINGKCDRTNFLAKEFFNFCYSNFDQIDLIKLYDKEFEFENFICKHTLDGRYIFDDSKIELDNNYFIGHSHKQYIIKQNKFNLINPGSVGQNRQFINEINFLIYDTKSAEVDFRSKLYNVDQIIDKMKLMNYPKACLDYYMSKSRK